MTTICHFAKLIDEQARLLGHRTALRYRDDERGRWFSVDWCEMRDRVESVAHALLWMDVRVQDNIGFWSQNVKESLYVDFAAYAVRACTVPIYATSSPAQVQFIVNDASIHALFVGDQTQYNAAFMLLPHCPTLEWIILVDPTIVKNREDTVSLFFDELLEIGDTHRQPDELCRRKSFATGDDRANILYTSGTTGESKGVIITHHMYIEAVRANDKIMPLTTDDVILNFLPFSHVLERAWSYFAICHGTVQAVNHDPHQVLRSMREIRPTCMCLVPRFWEKVYEAALERFHKMSPMLAMFAKRAIVLIRKYHVEYVSRGIQPPKKLEAKYSLLDRTFLHSIRHGLGLDRAHLFPTAGAAIDKDVELFVRCLGINILCGYGLTETTATVTCDRVGEPYMLGSVGKKLPGLEMRIGDNNEVLVRGETVTPGYYNNPQATHAVIDTDGWFHTGDAAYMKGDELFLTDRIKNLYKTSNGKYIAPALLESRLVIDKFIDQVVVIADRRKFVSALIVPNFDLIHEWAKKRAINYSDDCDLCKNKELYAFIEERVQTLQQSLAGYEQIKRFTLLPVAFSAATGEMTPTLKLRRQTIMAHYKDTIDSMYSDTGRNGDSETHKIG